MKEKYNPRITALKAVVKHPVRNALEEEQDLIQRLLHSELNAAGELYGGSK